MFVNFSCMSKIIIKSSFSWITEISQEKALEIARHLFESISGRTLNNFQKRINYINLKFEWITFTEEDFKIQIIKKQENE